MKKFLFLIIINLFFSQSISAIICYKQNKSYNTILFNNFTKFDVPDYLNIIIMNNPESVKIFNFKDIPFDIKYNISQRCFVITDCCNLSFFLPLNVRIEQNENFLIINTFNVDLNKISNNDKINTYIKLLKEHKTYLDFPDGLDLLDLSNLIDGYLEGTYNNKNNPYAQHATEITIGQMYFFDQEPLANDPKRFEKAFSLLNEASKKAFTLFELPKAQICLGLIYLSDEYSANDYLNSSKKALELFIKAAKMDDPLMQFVAKGLIEIAQDKINKFSIVEEYMIVDDSLN